MKVLHQIYHDKFLIKCLAAFVLSLLGVALALFAEDLSTGSTKGFVSFLGTIMAGIGPLIPLFINNKLSLNIKNLINQNFNRTELITFFILSQIVRGIIVILNYGIIVVILLVLKCKGVVPSGNANITWDISNYSMLFDIILAVVVMLYVSFAVPLFQANQKEMLRAQTDESRKKFTKKFIIYFIVGCFFIMSEIEIPFLVYGLLAIFLIIASGMVIFNRTFQLMHPRSFLKYVISFSITGCIPLILIIFLSKGQVSDNTLSFDDRLPNVTLLGNWHSYSSAEMEGFLRATSKSQRNYSKLLGRFRSELSLEKQLATIHKVIQAKGFIAHYTYSVGVISSTNMKKIINAFDAYVSKFRTNNEKDEILKYFNILVIRKSKEFSDEDLNELLMSQTKFKRVVGIKAAYAMFDHPRFRVFLERNKNKLLDDGLNFDEMLRKQKLYSEKNITK